jgi:NADP-dependent 3-hydroxy acid dehydrogenase YdfG
MNVKLKKLSDQVIVITGASSGIGLVTARMAAKRGARLILNARNEGTLRRVCDEIQEQGGEAYPVAGDVCSTRTIGAWSTVPSLLANTCSGAVARS